MTGGSELSLGSAADLAFILLRLLPPGLGLLGPGVAPLPGAGLLGLLVVAGLLQPGGRLAVQQLARHVVQQEQPSGPSLVIGTLLSKHLTYDHINYRSFCALNLKPQSAVTSIHVSSTCWWVNGNGRLLSSMNFKAQEMSLEPQLETFWQKVR